MADKQFLTIPELKGLKTLLISTYKENITLTELQQLLETSLQKQIEKTLEKLKPSEAQMFLTYIGYIDNQLNEEYKNNKGRNK